MAVRGYQTTPLGSLYQPRQYQINETLTFDTETEMKPAQRLRLGCYIYRIREREHVGLFYDNTVLSNKEIATLNAYAKEHGYNAQTIVGFQRHLTRLSTREGLAIVGFNLPFDFSRVSSRWFPDTNPNTNGFLFDFCGPMQLHIKHLSSRKSLYDFRGKKKAECIIVDLMTFGAALSGRSHSLDSLSRWLGTQHQKTEGEHGRELDATYIDYLVNDVRTTQDCYDELMSRYTSYQLDTPPHVIFSEASLGKAYLRQFGITPQRWSENPLPDNVQGLIMSTYYGGRSEVRIRREKVPVTYTDFLSMYPTVCAKMGLWQYVIAREIRYEDATSRVRELLSRAIEEGPELLRDSRVWRYLPCIVKVCPKGEILPVRARYSGQTYTIGLNKLSSEKAIWYTLADVLASVFLTGKVPEIIHAVGFSPGRPQTGLRKLPLLGRQGLDIDPYEDDFYRRLIELRKATDDDSEKIGLKILANSTCYGIFVEMIRETLPEETDVRYYSYDGREHKTQSCYTEKAGQWFAPLLATSITGAARLLLSCCERLARDRGLEWAFCDTDSMAIVADDERAKEKVREIVDWFAGLSPYSFDGSILKIEHEDVWAYCVSAKRYALFDEDGEIVKASAHGLGYLKRPYGEPMTKTTAPEWINDLWRCVLATDGEPCTPVDWSPLGLQETPALTQLTLNTAGIFRQLWRYNVKAKKHDVIRPFGFLGLFQHKLRGKLTVLAPLHDDPDTTVSGAFDRDSDLVIMPGDLRTYEDVLIGFDHHPESKFTDGDNSHVNRLERRHMVIENIDVIGKEANVLDDVAKYVNPWTPIQYQGREIVSNGTLLTPAPIHAHLKSRKPYQRRGSREGSKYGSQIE